MPEGSVVQRGLVAYHGRLIRQVPRRTASGLNGKLNTERHAPGRMFGL